MQRLRKINGMVNSRLVRTVVVGPTSSAVMFGKAKQIVFEHMARH